MRWFLMFLILAMMMSTSAALAEDEIFQWTLQFGGEGQTTPTAMALAQQGGALIAGNTSGDERDLGESYGGVDGFFIRVGASGSILWQRRIGGSGDDLFTHILEMDDGGWVVMGTTTSTDGDAHASRGAMDAFLVRLTAEGDVLWTKCLGGTLDDELLDIVKTEDGQLFVCGRTKSRNGDLGANLGGWDAWASLLSDDEGGKPLWVVRYGNAGDDQFTKALPAYDGWVLLGVLAEESEDLFEIRYQSRPIVLMLSSEQEELWQIPLGGTGINRIHMVTETEVGWVFVGETNSTSVFMPSVKGGMDIWMLHLRQSGGSMVWQRSFGGNSDDIPYQLRSVESGGFVLLATTQSQDGQIYSHGDRDLLMLRISSSGAQEWHQALGGSAQSIPAGLLFTEDGGFLIAGTSLSQDGDIGRHTSISTGFLSKLAPNGNLEWTRLVGGDSECSLLAMRSLNGASYLLGSFYQEDGDNPMACVFLGRLAGNYSGD